MLHPRHTKKRWFTVHVHADPEATQGVIKTLLQSHELVQHSDGRQHFQSFDILIAPKVFRKFQNELPPTIVIAYEPKESKP